MNDRDRTVIEKIAKYCDEIKQTHEFFQSDKEKFYSDDGFVYRNSVTMPILQIGELSKNLSDDFRKENATIPWKSIAGMRDVFAHHYGSIDYELVWDTSQNDIKDLKTFCESILNI